MNKDAVKHAIATDLEKAGQGKFTVAQQCGRLNFRYACREVSLAGGTARIRAHQHRFEDGRLQSEEFEATTDGAAYHDAVRATEGLVMSQVNSVAKLFSAFLPFSRLK